MLSSKNLLLHLVLLRLAQARDVFLIHEPGMWGQKLREQLGVLVRNLYGFDVTLGTQNALRRLLLVRVMIHRP